MGWITRAIVNCARDGSRRIATSVGSVLNEKLKRRIEKTRKENQQIIAGAVSNGLSTAVYRTTMVKFLLSRGASRDFTVPPFASPHRNIVMLAVALISIRGGNRHTCVRGLVKYQKHSHIFRGNSPDEVCSPSQILLHR
jgi:hypothetical protein